MPRQYFYISKKSIIKSQSPEEEKKYLVKRLSRKMTQRGEKEKVYINKILSKKGTFYRIPYNPSTIKWRGERYVEIAADDVYWIIIEGWKIYAIKKCNIITKEST